MTSPQRSQPLMLPGSDLPGIPASLLPTLAAAAAPDRVALVGGAVRDLLLHRVHADPWRGLPDLDLVVEPAAPATAGPRPAGRSAAQRLAQRLLESSPEASACRSCGGGGSPVVRAIREHGAFGTVELELECEGQRLLLDVATARLETYGQAGENPRVSFGSLSDDLARRDFSINAMALRLDARGQVLSLLDPHAGLEDLRQRRLRLLHDRSLSDDPTRLLRAARYAARLRFQLDQESQAQWHSTLARWPWAWRPGDPPGQAPPALGTRLRMELELVLERERTSAALAALQAWGGLALLDPALQNDAAWRRRLHWGHRFGLPSLAVLLAGAGDPVGLGQRLQIPHRQQRLIERYRAVRERLSGVDGGPGWPPSRWCALFEAPGEDPAAVALALCCGFRPRRPLIRWLNRWRHLRADLTAADLIAAGMAPGPLLGERLRELRRERLDRERP